MQAMGKMSLFLPSQVPDLSVEAGLVSMTQNARNGSGTQSEPEKNNSLFKKLFLQGINHIQNTDSDSTPDAEKICRSELSKEEEDLCDGCMISGMVDQMFPSQQPDQNTASGEPACTESETILAVTAEEQLFIGDATGIIQGCKNGNGTTDEGDTQLNRQETANRSAALNSGKEPSLIDKIEDGTELTAVSAAERKNETGREQIQTNYQDGGKTDSSDHKNSVTEHIIEAIMSAGEDGKAGESFEEFTPEREKHTLNQQSIETAAGIEMPTYLSGEGGENIELNRSVERALNQFINDFRQAEATDSEIKITLEPESMGVLTISVSRTENGISAKLKSDNKDVCVAISDHIQRLVRSMESKGVTVESMDVEYGGSEQNLSYAQHDFGGSGKRHSSYTARQDGESDAADGAGIPDLWQISPESNEQRATVEYRV